MSTDNTNIRNKEKMPVSLSLPLVQAYEKLMEAHNILAKSDLSSEDYGYYSRLLVQMKIKLQDTIHSGNAS